MTPYFSYMEVSDLRNFRTDTIDEDTLNKITLLSKKVRKDVLCMTMQAGSGHVGGSLSSLDIYLMLWLCADITPQNLSAGDRDRIVVSHGHTSPGLYAVLGNLGFFDIREAVENFRKGKSMFEGHPSIRVPGVEWASGSLGQGLSVGCGFALSSRLQKKDNRVFVVMGDGEQQKGQIAEARVFAVKHGLSRLTAIIDANRLQASGATTDIMPVDIQKSFEAAGWEVLSVDGHDFQELYSALKYTSSEGRPVAIFANTIMGKGVAAIENNFEYHGRILSGAQFEAAVDALETNGVDLNILPGAVNGAHSPVEYTIKPGTPVLYSTDKPVECRSAAGEAIYDIVRSNVGAPVVVLDCDLLESVKTGKVLSEFPDQFIQCGIQEHNAATVAGALSRSGMLPFFLDFGVFGIDETYGQHRMNDVNETSVKLIATHCGLDVGEDGKTHQCLDYISLTRNLPGYKLVIPADANQADRIVRYIACTPGNFVVAMGRSKIPVLKNERGDPFYSEQYSFSYGCTEWIREGNVGVIISTGTMVHRAVRAADILASENIHVGVLNVSCPGALDLDEIRKACSTGMVVTYEDHWVQSGLGTLVASVIAENELKCQFRRMGVAQYGKSCSAAEQYPFQGLDSDHLAESVKTMVGKHRAKFA